jgi:putative membrane protein
MNVLTKVFVAISSVLHVLFFVMESVLFQNEKVYTRFQLATAEQAAIVEPFIYNQGWYNLFLAIAAFAGVLLAGKWIKNVGETLAIYACLSMLGAAIVLFFSVPEMQRAAFIQGTFPLLALISYFLTIRKAHSKAE